MPLKKLQLMRPSLAVSRQKSRVASLEIVTPRNLRGEYAEKGNLKGLACGVPEEHGTPHA